MTKQQDTQKANAIIKDVFQDKDNSGVPDIFENEDGSIVTDKTVIKVNGKEYSSWDDVPADQQYLKDVSENALKLSTSAVKPKAHTTANPKLISSTIEMDNKTKPKEKPRSAFEILINNPTLSAVFAIMVVLIVYLLFFK